MWCLPQLIEFTKLNGFTDFTTLSVVHTHYLMLGMLFFLLLVLVEKNLHFVATKLSKYLLFYHIGLNLTVFVSCPWCSISSQFRCFKCSSFWNCRNWAFKFMCFYDFSVDFDWKLYQGLIFIISHNSINELYIKAILHLKFSFC